jgi:hypothetical protein
MTYLKFASITLLFFVLVLESQTCGQDALPYSSNIMGTLSDPRVFKELEIVGEQADTIRDLQREFGEIYGKMQRELREELSETDAEDKGFVVNQFRERMEGDRLRIVDQIKNELVPSQIKRLEQFTAQRKMRENQKQGGGLLSPQMKTYLQIKPDQEERIRTKSEEVGQRVREQIQKIIREAQQDLLSELTPAQKSKYQELVGDPMESTDPRDKDLRRREKEADKLFRKKEKKSDKVKGFDK